MIPFEGDKFKNMLVNFVDKIVSMQFNLKPIYLRDMSHEPFGMIAK